MAPARAALAAALDKTDVSAPLYDVFSTLDARPHARDAPEALRARLVEQLTRPALWEATCRALARAGINTFVDAGPGAQLTAMMKHIDAAAHAGCVDVWAGE